MTRDFMQTKVYAEWSCLGLVVLAKINGKLDMLLEGAKRGEGEFRVEDLRQAAMNETLLNDDERQKIAFFMTAAQERAAFLAKQAGNPRSRQS